MTVLSVVPSVAWSIRLFFHPPALLSLLDPLPPRFRARSISLFYTLSVRFAVSEAVSWLSSSPSRLY